MNLKQYLSSIETDNQVFGSVDEAQLRRLKPNDVVHLITETPVTLEAKSFVIEAIENGVNGTIILRASDSKKSTIFARDYNVFRGITGYGKTMSRMFTDMEIAGKYIESVLDMIEIREIKRDCDSAFLLAKARMQRGDTDHA